MNLKIKLNENEKQRKHIFLSDEEVVMHSKIKKFKGKIAFEDNEKSIKEWY